MNNSVRTASWVVYRMTLKGTAQGVGAVCEQREWEAIDAAKPGYHTLLQAGIPSEGEAERLARAASAEELALVSH